MSSSKSRKAELIQRPICSETPKLFVYSHPLLTREEYKVLLRLAGKGNYPPETIIRIAFEYCLLFVFRFVHPQDAQSKILTAKDIFTCFGLENLATLEQLPNYSHHLSDVSFLPATRDIIARYKKENLAELLSREECEFSVIDDDAAAVFWRFCQVWTVFLLRLKKNPRRFRGGSASEALLFRCSKHTFAQLFCRKTSMSAANFCRFQILEHMKLYKNERFVEALLRVDARERGEETEQEKAEEAYAQQQQRELGEKRKAKNKAKRENWLKKQLNKFEENESKREKRSTVPWSLGFRSPVEHPPLPPSSVYPPPFSAFR